MKHCVWFLILALLAPLSAFAATAPSAFVGDWSGVLDGGVQKLRMVVHISRSPAGEWTGTMDSPDQGAKGIPFDSVLVNDARIALVMSRIGGRYQGTLSEAGTINGHWSQGGMSLPLDLARGDGSGNGPHRPQAPLPPYPYRSQDVTYTGGASDVKIAGTFTWPAGDVRSPAVLLVSGSGPQNRDSEVMSHKPFHVLADYLTRKGIAVLRTDDRGIGKSTGSFATATSADFAADAAAGVAFLKSRPEVDPARIGVIGHSEGGIVAPLVAVQSSDVAFLVLMAGFADNIEVILRAQSRLMMEAGGTPESFIALNDSTIVTACRLVRAGGDPETLNARLDSAVDKMLARMTPEQKSAPGLSRDALVKAARAMNTPWFHYLLNYDPRATLEKVKVPVLALNGARDLQVPASQLDEIAAALKAGGNTRVEIQRFPGLNHLFQTAPTGLIVEYSEIAETMSPAVMERVASWVLALP